MTKGTDQTRSVSLYAVTPVARPDLAAPFVARHFHLSPEDALARLAHGGGPLATKLTPTAAQEASSLLSLLGIPVTTDPQETQLFDLSIQLALWAESERLAVFVARILQGSVDPILASLGKPGGLILPDLDRDSAQHIAQRLARRRGLIVTTSDHGTAIYDVYATRPLSGDEGKRLAAMSRVVGAGPDPLTDAVLAGLNHADTSALMARLPDIGLLPIDRRFQRFDLLLTGATGWTGPDLADFLVARTHKPRAAFEQIAPDKGVKLDTGLRAAVARQFCADYAAIGLMVRPVLSSRCRSA